MNRSMNEMVANSPQKFCFQLFTMWIVPQRVVAAKFEVFEGLRVMGSGAWLVLNDGRTGMLE